MMYLGLGLMMYLGLGLMYLGLGLMMYLGLGLMMYVSITTCNEHAPNKSVVVVLPFRVICCR
jgi:hypothetical protein